MTLVYRGPKILRGFDEDMRDALTSLDAEARHPRHRQPQLRSTSTSAAASCSLFTDHNEMIETDAVMLAIGRIPNTRWHGFEKAPASTLGKRGEVEVDEYSKTNVDHIYAIGDVTDRLALTPVAIHEAMCFVRTVFEGKPTPVDHKLVPTAVFASRKSARWA